jgi:hypothetical protein
VRKITLKPGSIEGRLFLWQAWARIAVEHEREALAGRRAFIQEWPNPTPETRPRELLASMVTVTSAMFGIEALANELEPYVDIPAVGGPRRARV